MSAIEIDLGLRLLASYNITAVLRDSNSLLIRITACTVVQAVV